MRLSSSLWIRGAPQNNSRFIVLIKLRVSSGTRGRPDRPSRTFHVEYQRTSINAKGFYKGHRLPSRFLGGYCHAKIAMLKTLDDIKLLPNAWRVASHWQRFRGVQKL
jgi:hypothetical protein